MADLRAAIAHAKLYKRMPAYPQGDIGALGQALGLPKPTSIRALIAALANLPAAVIILKGELNPPTDIVFYNLGLQSDGYASLKTHIHNSSVYDQYYFIGLAFDNVTFPGNKHPVFAVTGQVNAKLEFGSGEDNQQVDFYFPEIAEMWPQIVADNRCTARCKVELNGLGLILPIAVGVFAGLWALGGALMLVASSPSPYCNWQTGSDGDMHCSGASEDQPSQ